MRRTLMSFSVSTSSGRPSPSRSSAVIASSPPCHSGAASTSSTTAHTSCKGASISLLALPPRCAIALARHYRDLVQNVNMGVEPIPLGPEDRAILALECRTIAGHTCKVVRLAPDGEAGPFEIERLRARIAERIELAPALRRTLGGGAHEPLWVEDDGFEIDRQIAAAPVAAALDPPELPALVARLFEQRLDRSR